MTTQAYRCGHESIFAVPTDDCASCKTIAFLRALHADKSERPRTIEYSCGHIALVDATAEQAETLAAGLCGHCTDEMANPERWAADEAARDEHLERARIALTGTDEERAALYPPRYHYDDEFGTVEQIGGYRAVHAPEPLHPLEGAE